MNRSKGSSSSSEFKAVLVTVFVLLLIFSLIAFMRLSKDERLREQTKKQCATIAEKYAETYSLEYELVMAVIDCESGFDVNAVSHAGACGLMQLMPKTFEWMSDGEDASMIFDIEINIKTGCRYLSYLYGRFENNETVLAAYNAGEGNVSEWLKDNKYSDDGKTLKAIPYPETADYISRVLRAKADYSAK